MPVDDWEKDKESGDSKVTYRKNTGLSPIERYVTLIEDAFIVGGSEGLACIHSAANLAAGILCGVEDSAGNKKYYIAKPSSDEDNEKKKDQTNLQQLFDDVYKISSKEKLSLRFFKGGVKGTVGSSFTVDAGPDGAQDALKEARDEANRLALIDAQQNLIPISAKLGEEGFMDPLRKLSIAGENVRMRQNINADMEVYTVLKRDFEERMEDVIASADAQVEEMKRKFNAKTEAIQ